MNYPLISEYIEAIKSAEDNFATLTNLRPVLDGEGNPVMTSGNFAVVFKMRDKKSGKFYAVKCFLKDQPNRAESYKMIADELEYVSSTFLVQFRYLEKELFVDTNNSDEDEFPVLLMDWVEGVTLDNYIRQNIDDQYTLQMLAYQFSKLAMWIIPQPFAHGDIKPDNVMVRDDGSLVLIDYDGMYVPEMKGQKAREFGSPDFRHPSHTEDDFDEHIDDFPLVSILLSLRALANDSTLLEKYGAADRLLFSEKDYRNISSCKLLKELYPSSDNEINALVSIFTIAIIKSNISDISYRLLWFHKPSIQKEGNASNLKEKNSSFIDYQFTSEIKGGWPLLLFAKIHGPKLQIEDFVDEKTQSHFKSCIFTSSNGLRIFVSFSRRLGELTPLEIVSNKEKLYVICLKPGHYILCGHNEFLSYTEVPSTNLCEIDNLSSQLEEENFKNAKTDKYGGSYSPDGLRFIDICRDKYVFSKQTGAQTLLKQLALIARSSYSIQKGTKIICNGYSSYYINGRNVSGAFRNCEWIQGIEVPNTVILIGNSSFENCRSLRQIILPDSIQDIGSRAFKNCCSLTEVILPSNIREIREETFKGCESLITITIPNSVKRIDDNAFNGCRSLKSINIPQSVIKIGHNVFDNCNNLKQINIRQERSKLLEKQLPTNIIDLLTIIK